ncbi:putative transcription factor MYB family [Helianthus annuus]|nr:putative transcription factor MYB family [Helianthus annuus]KAJ0782388.1 putative transcription factor MYB family [Helianthus annuus]KAJ0815559.1 putative transcription factor MYB family [Helianthus annuus]KAJ0955990.1 putative transcription factor MYB family [Helianthus annuus]
MTKPHLFDQYMDPRFLHDHISEGGDTSGGCGSGVDRFPQWSIQETRDLLMIRAELDSTFMESKDKKLLWEFISTKMKERGYNRSVEQCKSKWKTLVTCYKGCETMEQEGYMMQQFPFYSELQTFFANRMQRLLWMEPSGLRKRAMEVSSDDEESRNAEKASGNNKKRKKVESGKLHEILEKYKIQQMQTEMQLMKMYEAKEEERRMKEMAWRKTMEEMEKERLMLDEQWREREDQRRVREEARAEKRDALITELLNKLTPN